MAGESSGAVVGDLSGHIVVCGMGCVGFEILSLLRRLGEPVAVISQSAPDERVAKLQEWGVTVIQGDARNERCLTAAGCAAARALIAATNQDLTNIEIALDAKSLNPELPIVVRLFDQSLARQ